MIARAQPPAALKIDLAALMNTGHEVDARLHQQSNHEVGTVVAIGQKNVTGGKPLQQLA